MNDIGNLRWSDLADALARIDACEREIAGLTKLKRNRAVPTLVDHGKRLDSLEANVAGHERDIGTLLRSNLDAWCTVSANDRAALDALRGRVDALENYTTDRHHEYGGRVEALESHLFGGSQVPEPTWDEIRERLSGVTDLMRGQPEPAYVWRYRNYCGDPWCYDRVAPENHWNYMERCMTGWTQWVRVDD